MSHGYGCVTRAEWLSRYNTRVLLNGAHVRYKGDDGLWWLGKISASTTTKGVYLVRFLDDPGPIKLPLPPVRTRLRQEHYEVLGAYKYPYLARLHGGSNVT